MSVTSERARRRPVSRASIDVSLRPLLDRLSPYCRRMLEGAAGTCMTRGSYEITIEHLLLSLIEDPSRDFQTILRHFETNPDKVQKTLHAAIEDGASGNTGKPIFSPLLIDWIKDAWLLTSVEYGLGEIRSGTLVSTLMANPDRYGGGDVFDELDAISPETLRRDLLSIVEPSSESSKKSVLATDTETNADPRNEDTALGRFTVDFTTRARAGEIDPVFCRDREIRQMVDILGRRRKNNPLAVGEAGVGKTALVEGLALQIADGSVPEFLKDVALLGLDLQRLQAGASVRGEFENRLKAVIDEVNASQQPIVLFIDEVHTLIGAGGSAGTGDAANLLKPALARGTLRTIAATTWSEYKKYIEKDAALARRFQLVSLDEPSPDQAVTIIRGLRAIYEKTHGVYVRDDAVEAAARLSARYISGRQLPDKAVDVLDTASARVKLSISAKPPRIEDCERRVQILERELVSIRRDIDAGTREPDERCDELEAEISEVEKELALLIPRWNEEQALAQDILALRAELATDATSVDDSDRAGVPQVLEVPSEFSEAEVDEPVEIIEEVPEDKRDSLKQALSKAISTLEALQGDDPLVHYEASPAVVARVIADWTGVPTGNMIKDEAATVLGFESALKERIFGQDHAVKAIDAGIRTAKAGLQNPSAPMGVFLLVGPSGVGKTETALSVADLLFGGERFMTTINMSEFMEKHSVSRLIGSPPGYVGFGEGGMLTEAVRQRPYSVVLLDEVEKAHPDVLNLFYQVFDKGSLADGESRMIDFKNTMLFLTSNLASDIIMKFQDREGDEATSVDRLIEKIRPELSRHFKPALLARMKIVPYFRLDADVMRNIVTLKLERLGKRLETNQGLALSYAPEVIDEIARRCSEPETGARNVDHVLNAQLVPHISTEILEKLSDDTLPDSIHIDVDQHNDFSYSFG